MALVSERGGNGVGIWAVGGAAAVHVAEERRHSEAALAFAASIVESSDDAIVGMTLYGIITSWNAGAERLYGYTGREVFGRWPIGITIPENELLDPFSPSDRWLAPQTRRCDWSARDPRPPTERGQFVRLFTETTRSSSWG